MKVGAIALIDALGFRGIWARQDAETVLGQLQRIKQWFESRITEQFSTQPWMQCAVTFLSDTIAVSMALDRSAKGLEDLSTADVEALSAIYLCDVISWVLDQVTRSDITLTYRGAVAVGHYEMSPHFLIGEAVDQAAATFELAQGAIIWLTPSARDPVAQWLRKRPGKTHLVKFDVPLKGGSIFNTYTVSPFQQARDERDANQLARAIMVSFSSPRLDIAIKRQHTANQLRACYAWRGFKFPYELSVLCS